MRLWVASSLAAALAAAAQDAPKQFTARELFYAAGDDTDAKPAAKPVARPAQTAVTAAKKPPAQVAGANPAPASTPQPPARSSTVTASRVQGSKVAAAPDGSPIIRAAETRPATAPAPTNGPALGLKITVLKRVGNDNVEVAPDTVFHAGDRIQFSVQTNGPGYLYIVNQGSSGTWKPIFPSPEVSDGDNHVDGWRSYLMPPRSRMVFDEQTGTEKVFIVFSREPEAEFENMIYSLPGSKGQSMTPTPAKSAPEPAARPQKSMLVVAQVNLPDSEISRMRQVYSRDLIVEKVDDTAPGPGEKKEKAVYVVNPTGSTDPRVVADLQLVHQ